jgi:hypothetical protein
VAELDLARRNPRKFEHGVGARDLRKHPAIVIDANFAVVERKNGLLKSWWEVWKD